MKTIKKLSDSYKSNRELILIGLVDRYYRRVYESRVGDMAGSLSVADFFSKFVDKLLADKEYNNAVIHAVSKQHINPIGSEIWHYFHVHHKTSLDWYYYDKAADMIDEFIANYREC